MAGLVRHIVRAEQHHCLFRRLVRPRKQLSSVRGLSSLLDSRVNAPSSLPPPLTLPAPRTNSEYRITYAYKLGKSYLQFYKAAAKQILNNRKVAKSIRARHKHSPLLRDIPGDAVNHKTGQIVEVTAGGPETPLSRAEYQLIRRHARDIKKVPVFAVLLAIFGEWLPLFVMVLDPLLPGTVLLPAQVLKRRRKAAKITSERGLNDLVGSKGDLEGAGIHDRAQLLQIARRYGLLGPVSQFATSVSVLKKVRRHQAYLAIDDGLMKRDLPGNSEKEVLSADELDVAIEERGLWKEDLDYNEKSSALHTWLNHDGKDNVTIDENQR